MKRNPVAQFVIFMSSLFQWVMSIKTNDNSELNLVKRRELTGRVIPDCPYRTK